MSFLGVATNNLMSYFPGFDRLWIYYLYEYYTSFLPELNEQEIKALKKKDSLSFMTEALKEVQAGGERR